MFLPGIALALLVAQDLEGFAKAHLPPGAGLAHPPVSGAFGPAGKHIVLLYRDDPDDSGEFRGTVYLDGRRPQQLPPLGLIANQFAVDVKAVFFASKDLLVLYGYHRNGSEADDSHACAVYRWNGSGFIRVSDVEHKIAGLATASAVRQRLGRLSPTMNKQGDIRK